MKDIFDIKKPILLFTTFWKAKSIIDNGCYIFEKDEKTVNIRIDDQRKLQKYSIALSQPKNCHLERVDCLCPTYDILMDYKNNKDWDSYTKLYTELIKNRRNKIVNFVESIDKDSICFMCCWENTSKGAHCHREIVYNMFNNSENMKKRVYLVYDHG